MLVCDCHAVSKLLNQPNTTVDQPRCLGQTGFPLISKPHEARIPLLATSDRGLTPLHATVRNSLKKLANHQAKCRDQYSIASGREARDLQQPVKSVFLRSTRTDIVRRARRGGCGHALSTHPLPAYATDRRFFLALKCVSKAASNRGVSHRLCPYGGRYTYPFTRPKCHYTLRNEPTLQFIIQ